MALSIWDDEDLVESLGYTCAYERLFDAPARRERVRMPRRERPRQQRMTVAQLRAKARAVTLSRPKPSRYWSQLSLFEVAA